LNARWGSKKNKLKPAASAAENKYMSKPEIAVLLVLVVVTLCVTLYEAWISPLEALAVVVVLAVAVLGFAEIK
jgi:hypothetical protein